MSNNKLKQVLINKSKHTDIQKNIQKNIQISKKKL